jgi:hypothetical protein
MDTSGRRNRAPPPTNAVAHRARTPHTRAYSGRTSRGLALPGGAHPAAADEAHAEQGRRCGGPDRHGRPSAEPAPPEHTAAARYGDSRFLMGHTRRPRTRRARLAGVMVPPFTPPGAGGPLPDRPSPREPAVLRPPEPEPLGPRPVRRGGGRSRGSRSEPPDAMKTGGNGLQRTGGSLSRSERRSAGVPAGGGSPGPTAPPAPLTPRFRRGREPHGGRSTPITGMCHRTPDTRAFGVLRGRPPRRTRLPHRPGPGFGSAETPRFPEATAHARPAGWPCPAASGTGVAGRTVFRSAG